MARADRMGRVVSDDVFTMRNDGLIIDGKLMVIIDPVTIRPGDKIDAHFELPNDGITRRACCALIVLNDEPEKIILPGLAAL